MSFKEYTDFDATGLANLLRQGEVSPAELVMATFERFQRHNPALKNRGGRAVLGSRLRTERQSAEDYLAPGRAQSPRTAKAIVGRDQSATRQGNAKSRPRGSSLTRGPASRDQPSSTMAAVQA